MQTITITLPDTVDVERLAEFVDAKLFNLMPDVEFRVEVSENAS